MSDATAIHSVAHPPTASTTKTPLFTSDNAMFCLMMRSVR